MTRQLSVRPHRTTARYNPSQWIGGPATSHIRRRTPSPTTANKMQLIGVRAASHITRRTPRRLNLLDLPGEILAEILQYVPHYVARPVCRAFRDFCKVPLRVGLRVEAVHAITKVARAAVLSIIDTNEEDPNRHKCDRSCKEGTCERTALATFTNSKIRCDDDLMTACSTSGLRFSTDWRFHTSPADNTDRKVKIWVRFCGTNRTSVVSVPMPVKYMPSGLIGPLTFRETQFVHLATHVARYYTSTVRVRLSRILDAAYTITEDEYETPDDMRKSIARGVHLWRGEGPLDW